jgi:DNA-binding MarR family transcriptional regulator
MINKRQHVVNNKRPARSAAGDAFSSFAITALRLAGHLTKAGDAIAKPAGQTSARWQVLAGARHETMSVAQIAKTLGVARQGIQRLADVLEAEGLVAYVDNRNHQRAKLVVLTGAGRAKLATIDAGQARWADTLGAELGEKMLNEATLAMTCALEHLNKER